MAKGKKASVKKSSSMGSRKLKSKQSQKSDNISTTEEFNRILNSDTHLKGKKKSKKASKKNSKQEHPSTIRSFFNGMGNNMMGMQQQQMHEPMMGMQQPMMGDSMMGMQQQQIHDPMMGMQQQQMHDPMMGMQQPMMGMQNPMMGMQQQPMQNPMMGMQQQPMMGEGSIMGQLHNQMGVNQNGGFNLKNLANLSSTTILK